MSGEKQSSERASAEEPAAATRTRPSSAPGQAFLRQRQSPARRAPSVEQELSQDDSFSEERFVSPASLPTGSSWESQSFDSEGERSRSSRPSSRTSLRDRRKQFDTTTPTLIDEEDELEYAEEEEMISLEQARLQGYSIKEVDDEESSELRRTPGATQMHRSSYEESRRTRTPGVEATMLQAPQQQQGKATTTPSPQHEDESGTTGSLGKESVGLGFGLTLSTPVGAETETRREQEKAKIWESFSSHSATPSPQKEISSESTSRPPSRPPRAPGAGAASTSGGGGSGQARGPFAFTPWTGTKGPTSSSSQAQPEGRISPSILRLTEDIGNLLQDEDDAYTREIPSVFRTGDTPSEPSGNWMGSYTLESEGAEGQQAQFSSGTGDTVNVVRPGTNPKQPSRRLPNAQQPKPRRSGNERFEFGRSQEDASRRSGGESAGSRQSSNEPQASGGGMFVFGKPRDDRESPQLLNFGGAFAPPAKEYAASVMRPVASSGMSFGAAVPPNLQQGPVGEAERAGIGERAQSFDSYEPYHGAPSQAAAPMGHYASQSPVFGSSMRTQAPRRSSDMQATAREFVPKATRNTPSPYASQRHAMGPSPPAQMMGPPSHPMQMTGPPPQSMPMMAPHPQQPVQLKPPPQTMQVGYDVAAHQQGWQQPPAYGSYGSSYGYNVRPGRSSVSPSPHVPAWQQQQAQQQIHVQQHPPQQLQVQKQPQQAQQPAQAQQKPKAEEVAPRQKEPAPRPASMPASSQMQQVLSVPDPSRPEAQRPKKEGGTKRGKRGKKKSTKEKAEASAASGAITAAAGKKKRSGRSSATQDRSETPALASDDPVDAKRAELVESPSTRAAFKDFYRTFRAEERLSAQKAEEFAAQSLEDDSLPDSVHWRVYLELADLAKRSNRFDEARRLYQKVCQLQPYASQVWLEYSKLEEECGHVNRVTNILLAGLEFCEHSENLLTRAVKHHEKLGDLGRARELLARLKHIGIEKVWRTVLEGALLEARAGNHGMARRVLKYLMHHIPWYGPLYLEAYRLEREQGNLLDAFAIIQRGLVAIPRYGPLWFGAFRVGEEIDMARKHYQLPTAMRMIERARTGVSKELVWKVHLEAAQMIERSALHQTLEPGPRLDALIMPARKQFAMTILNAPANLRWRVWLAAARMELEIGNFETARALFHRAHRVVPDKGKSGTLLELARLEEFIGHPDLARAILCRGRREFGTDWKVLLESVQVEIRSGDLKRALAMNVRALDIHQGTGRLWAALISLSHIRGRESDQNAALLQALSVVPKSGEVWCEGGRIRLNPFSDVFDIERARRHLTFASKFTPQFGDSFIEMVRLEMLDQWLSPIAEYIWDKTKSAFLPASASFQGDRLTKYITDVSLAIAIASQEEDKDVRSLKGVSHQGIISTVRQRLTPEACRDAVDLTDLRLTCSNADPNYGPMWFHCRRVPTDLPRKVIEDAAGAIALEVHKYARVYLAAMIRRTAVLATLERELKQLGPGSVKWEGCADEGLRAAPSLKEIYNPLDPTTGLVLLESTIGGSLFVTGLTELNKHRPIQGMSLSDRRKHLFGTDALFP